MSYIISTKLSKISNFREMKKLMRQLCSILPFVCILVTQSCPTLCDSMDCSPPGKDTRVGCHSLLQRIFPTQGSSPGLLHCRQILYHLSYEEALYHLVRAKKEKEKKTWSNQETYATLYQFSWAGFLTPSADIYYGPRLKSPSNEQ